MSLTVALTGWLWLLYRWCQFDKASEIEAAVRETSWCQFPAESKTHTNIHNTHNSCRLAGVQTPPLARLSLDANDREKRKPTLSFRKRRAAPGSLLYLSFHIRKAFLGLFMVFLLLSSESRETNDFSNSSGPTE